MSHESGTSIIIPTFNRPEWAAELVGQLVAQQEHSGGLEVLLVNDNGDRAVFEHAQTAAAGSNVALRCFDTGYEGFGVALARNIGLAFARYALCLFLDDDVIAPAQLVSRHQSTADTCLRLGRIDSLLVTDGREEVVEDRRDILKGQDGSVSDISECLGMLHGGHFSVPTGLAMVLGGFDEEFLDEEEEDMDFGARAILATRQLYVLASARVLHRGLDSFSLRERGLGGGRNLPRLANERFQTRGNLVVNGGPDHFLGDRWQQYQC